jgi:hypothetical protein
MELQEYAQCDAIGLCRLMRAVDGPLAGVPSLIKDSGPMAAGVPSPSAVAVSTASSRAKTTTG